MMPSHDVFASKLVAYVIHGTEFMTLPGFG